VKNARLSPNWLFSANAEIVHIAEIPDLLALAIGG
jgi:hypothetical protein